MADEAHLGALLDSVQFQEDLLESYQVSQDQKPAATEKVCIRTTANMSLWDKIIRKVVTYKIKNAQVMEIVHA